MWVHRVHVKGTTGADFPREVHNPLDKNPFLIIFDVGLVR